MKKFIARCHKLKCDNRQPHSPELSERRKTLKEILVVGKEMMNRNKTHVYINWEKGNRGYLISYPTGRVDIHNLKK